MYFRNDTQKTLVNGVYTGISNYMAKGNNYGIIEFCDPNGTDGGCTDEEGTIAYNQPGQGASSSITFCKSWFSLPLALTCSFASKDTLELLDQGGAYLHELTHSPNLVGVQGILDGNQANCYDWFVLGPFPFIDDVS